MTSNLLRSLALVTTVAIIPAASAAFAAVDVSTYRELDQFMAVFERVRAEYVDKVDDKTLIHGAIDGMLASLDPHSSYLDETRLPVADDDHRGRIWRPRPQRHDGRRRGEGGRRRSRTAPPTRPGSRRATTSPI